MYWKRFGLFFIGGFIAGSVILESLDWAKKKYRKYKYQPSEVKFVRNTNKICKGHIFSKTVCSDDISKIDPTFQCSYAIILWMVEFFDSAKKTLDIAVYLVTCEAFSEAILRAHERGVQVRIFTDFTMAKGSGSAIAKFIKSGIPVSMLEQSRMMHRKSAISDKSRLLIGTGNWTMQALAGNWDMWYQTSDPDVLAAFNEEFEILWAVEDVMRPSFDEFNKMKLEKTSGFIVNVRNGVNHN